MLVLILLCLPVYYLQNVLQSKAQRVFPPRKKYQNLVWVVLLVTGFVGLAKLFGLLVTGNSFTRLVLFAGLGSAFKGLVMCLLDGCEVRRAGWRGILLRFLL